MLSIPRHRGQVSPDGTRQARPTTLFHDAAKFGRSALVPRFSADSRTISAESRAITSGDQPEHGVQPHRVTRNRPPHEKDMGEPHPPHTIRPYTRPGQADQSTVSDRDSRYAWRSCGVHAQAAQRRRECGATQARSERGPTVIETRGGHDKPGRYPTRLQPHNAP